MQEQSWSSRLETASQYYQNAAASDTIGRLCEKSVHGILKFYLDDDPTHHEVPLPEGPVADIFDGKLVTEIQSANYGALAKKLPKLLPHYSVKVVCPLLRERYLYTLSGETGSVDNIRKSPLHGARHTALVALADLDPFFDHPNFKIEFYLIDVAEYRVPTANKRKPYEKRDRVPTAIVDVFCVEGREDYQGLLPSGLSMQFTAKEFTKKIGQRPRKANYVLKLLQKSGVIKRVGLEGRAYLYEIQSPKSMEV